MNDLTDQQLLRDYAGRQSEAAFAELVRRHVDFVYSSALRMVRDAHLAEDVTQGAFVALAQNARQLTDHPVLSGWLHRTTQNLATKTVRGDVRRRAREQEAVAMNQLLATESDLSRPSETEADAWELVAPHLDAALGELTEPDRDALLLRYFERKSAREMAQTLGTSEDAAQKRVSRAVERLREFFAKRGVTVGASGLIDVISANAVQAAPVGLAVTISTAVTLAGTALTTTATATATKIIAMTTLQKTIVTATIAVLAGAGIYEARQAANAHAKAQTLQQQQAPMADQIQQLQHERDAATNQVAVLRDEVERLNRKTAELLKLRGEVGSLRRELADAKQSVMLSNDLAKTWSIGQTKWSKDWKNAGLSSPKAALETYHWAAANTNFQTMSQCLIFDYRTNTESPPELFANRKVRSELAELNNGLMGGIRIYSVAQLSDDRARIAIEKMVRVGVEAVRPGINGTDDHYFKLSDPPEWNPLEETVDMLKVNGDWKVVADQNHLSLTPDDEDSNAVAEAMMKMGPNELEQIKTRVPLRTLRAYEALKAKSAK